MRVVAHIGLVACLSATLLGSPQAPPKDAATVMAAAREALGGEKNITAVKNFAVTGRTRQVRGDNLVPIEFEISVELPDKYVRKDEIPAQESGPTSSGFNGEALIQLPVPPAPPAAPGREGAPAPPQAMLDAARKARVNTVKQDFARLTLGMFATSFQSYPLTFTYAGQAEAPEGKADVIDAKGPDNFTVRLFVNSQTHLPIMLSWQVTPAGRGRPGGMPGSGPGGAPGAAPGGRGGGAPGAPGAPPTAAPAGAPPAGAPPAGAPATPPPAAAPPGAPPAGGQPPAGAPPGAGAPAGARAPGAAPQAPGAATPGAPGQPPAGPPKPVEHRLYFSDYRPVGNLQLPFRIKRAVGPDTTEETTFDRFRVNGKIDPKKFEVPK